MGTKPASASAGRRAAGVTIERVLDGVAATAALAEVIARVVKPGDVIALFGDLGTGKTEFARAFIRARAGSMTTDRAVEVPSPTFTLVQTYDCPEGTIWHFDLFRLDGPQDVVELGFEEALANGIVLIEWPDRLDGALPEDRLELKLEFADAPDRRYAKLVGQGFWRDRMAGLEVEICNA